MEAVRKTEYTSTALDDSTIVGRVAKGEYELFEILMRRYNQRLYRIVRTYLKDEDEVQDAMQNTYLKAFDKIGQFHGDASFSTWLIRIGINESLLRLKSMKKGKVVYLHGAEKYALQIADSQMNAENKIIRQETKQLLETAIDSLPEKYRIVYMLREVEGLSTEEVCAMLSITESNLKVRLHRSKAILKEYLLTLSRESNVFEFGNARCDALVEHIMKKLASRVA